MRVNTQISLPSQCQSGTIKTALVWVIGDRLLDAEWHE